MSSAAWIRRKGPQFETDVVNYVTDRGLKVVRMGKKGSKDEGDIYGVPNWILECKNTKAIDLGAARREATVEAINAGVDYFAAIHKKRQAGVKDAYVEIPLWAFVDLLIAVQGR